MHHEDIAFHNVGELVADAGRGPDGRLLQRVPESVRADLNDGAKRRVRHPAGVELRFVPEGSVEVTLSVEPQNGVETSTVRVFWGPFQERVEHEIGPEPTTIEVSMPEKLDRIDPDERATLAFDPRVCRLRFPGEHRGGWVSYHGAAGERRPPREAECPDLTYLAYGTSITEGEAALGEHLTYVGQTANRLGANLVNLGTCGSNYCDAAMADHIAAREDWDVATLALSVNMVGTFTPAEFRERAANMVETVAAAHPEKPVVPITIYPNSRDLVPDHEEGAVCERFREELREIVAETDRDNVTLLEGADLLTDVGGLTTDLVHPGDNAMVRMGERLADELEPLV